MVPILIYLLTIGLVWWALRSALSSSGTLLLPTAAVVGLGFLVPFAANVSTRNAYAQAIGGDILPGQRVVLSGDIYLDDVNINALPSRNRRRYATPVSFIHDVRGAVSRVARYPRRNQRDRRAGTSGSANSAVG